MPTNRTSTSAYIAAKPEEVFEAVSDLTRHPQFAANEDLTVEAVSEGEAAVGSAYRSKVRFMGSNVEAELRVTEFQSPSRFCFVATDSSGVHTHEINIRPDNGGSHVERTSIGVSYLHRIQGMGLEVRREARHDEVVPEAHGTRRNGWSLGPVVLNGARLRVSTSLKPSQQHCRLPYD